MSENLLLIRHIGYIVQSTSGKRTRYIREGVRDPRPVTSAPSCYPTKRAAITALHAAVKTERGRAKWRVARAFT